MDDHYFEEHFRETFSDFEAPTSEDVWSRIQSSIPTKNRRIAVWPRVAVIATILLAIPLGLGELSKEIKDAKKPSAKVLINGVMSDEIRSGDITSSVTRERAIVSQENIAEGERDSFFTKSDSMIAPSDRETLPEISIETRQSRLTVSSVVSNGIKELSMDTSLPQRLHFVSLPDELVSVVVSEAQKRVGIGMYFSVTPFLSYQQFSPSSQDLVLVQEAESLPTLHPSRIGFQGSWGVELPVSRRLQLSAGLLYQFRPQQISLELTSWEQNTTTLVKGGVQLTPQFQSGSQNYSTPSHSVGGSTLLWYSLAPEHRRQPQFGAGVQATRLLNPAANDYEIHQPAWQPSLTAAYRIVYPLKPGWHLQLQPTFNYPVLLGKDSRKLLSTRPYFFGIGIQLNY